MLPLMYYPTMTICVDDHYGFLHALKSSSRMLENRIEIFQDVHESMEWLTHYTCSRIDSQYPINDLSCFEKIVSSSEKNVEVSVAYIDYAMPSMNGLEFCQKIQKHLSQKILLTGKADEYMGIEALNTGFINGFIRKDQKSFEDILGKTLKEFQMRYFLGLTRPFFTFLSGHAQHLLSDKNFEGCFQQFVEEKKIVEFFVMNKEGDFLMKSAQGKKIIFKTSP